MPHVPPSGSATVFRWHFQWNLLPYGTNILNFTVLRLLAEL